MALFCLAAGYRKGCYYFKVVTQVNILKSCCGLFCNKCNSTYLVSTSYQFLFCYAHSYISLLHGKQYFYRVCFIQYPLIQITQKT